MPIESIDDLTRRLCLLYPWSRECQGVPPIIPTDGERSGMWGYQVAQSIRNIPTGSQCESVQLIPVAAVGKQIGSVRVGYETQLPSVVHTQFPLPTTVSSIPAGLVIGYFPKKLKISEFFY
jgi:hypothetical protein